MDYFAFIIRASETRYRATLPDFPGCIAECRRIAGMEAAIRKAVAAHMGDRAGPYPEPTRAGALPRSEADLDGFWMLVNLAPRADSAHEPDEA